MGYVLKILLNIFDYFTLQKVLKKIEFLIGKNFSTLIDVGSHHGEYILSIKKKFNVDEIYGFEPNPAALKILKRNINEIRGINVYDYGIADIEEVKILNQNIESSSSSINHLNENSTHLVDYGGTRDDAVLFKSKVNSAINALKEINKLLE